jgi:hypothetical protein
VSRQSQDLQDVLELSALLKPLALPREARQTSLTKHLGDDLGNSPIIETQRVSEANPKPKSKPLKRALKPIEHSVYIGREMLGRLVQSGKKIKAFDAGDRPLGSFRVHARALAAIRKARRARA